MQTYISYKTAKKLKEFLGESAVEPMGGEYTWQYPTIDSVKIDEVNEYPPKGIEKYPAYRLEDLLSKPFCEAFCCKIDGGDWPITKENPRYLAKRLYEYYYPDGLPAVEKALMEMMEAK